MAKKKKKKVTKKKNTNTKKKKNVSSAKKKNTAKKTVNTKSAATKQTATTKKSSSTKSVANKKNESSKTSVIDKNNKVKKQENNKKKLNKKPNISDKKKRKLNIKLLVISFIMLILCIVVIIFINNNINNRKVTNDFISINFDEYLDLYEKESLEFVYLYHSSCINCDSYEEKLFKLEKEFNIKIRKFNYSKLNESDLSILKSSNSFLEDGIEVPMIISIKNGSSISSISGIKEYSALKNFVSLSKSEIGINKFDKININDYLYLLGSKEKSLIYICDSSDSCNKFSTLLDSVTTERKVKVNYLNTENITSSDDWEKLESSNKIFEKMWFMPALLVVKDNKVIDYKMETLNEKDLNKFLKKNGL